MANQVKCLSVLLGACNTPVDVMFVVDGSGSVKHTNFQKLLQFMSEFAMTFQIGSGPHGTQIGVIIFSDNVLNKFKMASYSNKYDMINKILGIKYPGEGTNTYLALDYVRNSIFTASEGDRPNVPNVAIVMTDGKSSDSSKTKEAALKLKQSNVEVIGIGIGTDVDKDEIRAIASGSDEENLSYFMEDFNALKSILNELKDKTCSVGAGNFIIYSSLQESADQIRWIY